MDSYFIVNVFGEEVVEYRLCKSRVAFSKIFLTHLHFGFRKYTFALPFWKKVGRQAETRSLENRNLQLITSGSRKVGRG